MTITTPMTPARADRRGPAHGAPRINLIGVKVSALNLETAADRIVQAVRRGDHGYVCVCGAHGLIECQDDDELRRIFGDAFLVTPDGMPLVWELRRRGHRDAGRVYGPDLMLKLLDRGLTHYLYGTTDETLDRLETRIALEFPRARVVGRYAPPFRPLTDDEETEIVRRINAADADIVWVGLSTPRQERWMARMRPKLNARILVGVGAAFDFHAGNVPQAPGVLQEAGLEWAYRLVREPRRLWRRYARVVPGYLYLLSRQRLGLERFPGGQDDPVGTKGADRLPVGGPKES